MFQVFYVNVMTFINDCKAVLITATFQGSEQLIGTKNSERQSTRERSVQRADKPLTRDSNALELHFM